MRVSVKPWLRPYVQQIAADLGCGEDFTEALAQIIIEHREFRRGASVTGRSPRT